MYKKKCGSWTGVKKVMKRKAMKKWDDSCAEITIELDGRILFKGHQDDMKAKRILEKNPNARVVKGLNNKT